MADTKISALTAGAPAVGTDILPIDRAGANFSLTGADLVALAAVTLAPKASPTFTGTATSPVFSASGSNGGITGTEGTGAGLTAAGSVDLLWPDSVAHRWKMNNNNAGAVSVVGISTPGTAGNTVKLGANGIDVVDSGTPSTNTTSGLWLPTYPGSAIGSIASLVLAQNETDGIRFTAPFTGTFTRVTYQPTVSAGVGSHVGFAIYDSTGATRLMTTGALDGTLTGAQTVTVASFTLRENTDYILIWTNDQATATTWACQANPATGATVANFMNPSGGTIGWLKGTTASAAGAPPASLSTIVARTTGNGMPFVFVSP